jgi:hypothetical protein
MHVFHAFQCDLDAILCNSMRACVVQCVLVNVQFRLMFSAAE